MRLVIRGHHLPGLRCGRYANVHVGLQVRGEPNVQDDRFTMFRRAKLMLADLPAGAEQVTVEVGLTDEHGMPRCARLRPPALSIR